MKNLIFFLLLLLLMAIALLLGHQSLRASSAAQGKKPSEFVPHIGSVQVLNGCGIAGAAGQMADFLRAKGFDVKEVGNADGWSEAVAAWNYPFTIIVSKRQDMSIATRVARELNTDKLILMRDDENMYDVIVYLGSDYGELIQ